MRPLVVLFPGFLIACLQFSWVSAQTPLPPSTFPSATTSTSTVTSGTTSNATSSATQTSSSAFPSLGGYSSCVTMCLALGSVAANCTSVVDVNCYCVSKRFTREIVDCISKGCPSELTTAESLAQEFCNVPSNSTALSFPPVTLSPTSTSSSASISSSQSSQSSSTTTAPSSATTSTTSATTSNAASQGFSVGAGGADPSTFCSIVICVLGALLGAYLVE